MNDQYGRRIDYMRVSVTDRCNLRCVYCMPGEGFSFLPHEDILSFEEIERVCRIGVRLGITKIKLTGGEPLVRRGIPDLVGKLKGIPGIDEVTLTTNGILLKEQINELVSNGLASVNISIDTLDERRYFRMTRGGDIKKALEGMESALKYPDLKVKVNCYAVHYGRQPVEKYFFDVRFCICLLNNNLKIVLLHLKGGASP